MVVTESDQSRDWIAFDHKGRAVLRSNQGFEQRGTLEYRATKSGSQKNRLRSLLGIRMVHQRRVE